MADLGRSLFRRGGQARQENDIIEFELGSHTGRVHGTGICGQSIDHKGAKIYPKGPRAKHMMIGNRV